MITQNISSLLEPVTSVSLPAIERFAARDHFVIDVSDNAQVKLGAMDGNFIRYILDIVDEDIPAAILDIHELKEDSFDSMIVRELKAPHTFISHMYQLMMLQPRGEPGALLRDGGNLAYILDPCGETWAVCPYWHTGKEFWEIEAYQTHDDIKWTQRFQIISMKWFDFKPAA